MTKKELYRQMDKIVGKDNVIEYPKGFSAKCTVSTYEQFEEIIKLCNEYYKELGLSVCYRGQKNSSWKLRPSISRYKNFYKYEYDLLKNFMCVTNSKKLSVDDIFKAQHYGLTTRLLDVTTDYRVALWFACQFSSYDNGNLINGSVFVLPQNSNDDKKIFEQYNIWQIEHIDEVLKCTNVDEIKKIFADKFDITENLDKSYGKINVFKSSLSDKRIENQSALGALCDLYVMTGNTRKACFYPSVSTSMSVAILIDAHEKENMLNELNEKGINEKFLFEDDLEHYSRYLIKKYSNIKEEK